MENPTTFEEALEQVLDEGSEKEIRCKTCRAARQDESIARALTSNLPGTVIARAMRKVGYDVSGHAVQRHRRDHMETTQ